MEKIQFKRLETMDEVYRSMCWATGENIDRAALKIMKARKSFDPKNSYGEVINAFACYVKHTMMGYIEFDITKYSRTLELKELIVAPKFRNKGYGTRLFSSLVMYCRTNDLKLINFTDPNEKLLEFLKNRGFVNIYSDIYEFTIPKLQKI